MVKRKVFVSAYNDENYKNKLLEKSISYINKNQGNRFFYIVPNGRIINYYRKFFVENCNYLSNLNIITFQDIGKEFVDLSGKKLIDENLKQMLLINIMEKYSDLKDFHSYRNFLKHRGFIEELSAIIRNLKTSLINPEKYLNHIQSDGHLKNLASLYKEYELYLEENNLMDVDDYYLILIDAIKNKKLDDLNKLDFIIIDDFDSFRKQEYKLIEELSKYNLDIYINIPYARLDGFAHIDNTITNLKGLGYEIIDNCIEEDRGLISNRIFSRNKENIKLNTNLSLIKAPSKKLEVYKVIEIVKEKYIQGFALTDMAIIVPNMKEYEAILTEAFKSEKLANTLEEKYLLISSHIAKELINIYVYLEARENTSFINIINSKYFKFSSGEYTDDLEDIYRQNLELDDNIEKDLLEEIIEIKQKVSHIEEFLGSARTLKDYLISSLDLIKYFNLVENIYSNYHQNNNYNILYRDLKIIEKIKEDFESFIDLSISRKKIKRKDYVDFLIMYFENTYISLYEGNNSGISVLSLETARGLNFKSIFILGLTQGEYPNLERGASPIIEKNIKFFKELGLEYKGYYERLDKAAFDFTRILSLAEEDIYLSYSENLSESSLPSIFWDEIILVAEESKNHINYIDMDLSYNLDLDLEEITNERKLYFYLCQNKFLTEEVDTVMVKDVARRAEIEKNRFIEENPYNGFIRNEQILRNLSKSLENKVYSPSFLESYGQCPLSFYLERILSLDSYSRDGQEIGNLEFSLINSKIIDRFYEENKRNIKVYLDENNNTDIDIEYISAYIKENYFKELINMNYSITSPIFNLQMEMNIRKLTDYIKSDLENMKELPFQIKFYVDQEENKTSKSREIEIEGKNYYISTRVDRIDIWDEKGIVMKNYKNSNYRIYNEKDIKEGLSLYLPLTSLVFEDEEVIALIYDIIPRKESKILLFDNDYEEFISKEKFNNLSEEELEDLRNIAKAYIEEYMAKIENGYFPASDKSCPSFCKFKDLCRLAKGV